MQQFIWRSPRLALGAGILCLAVLSSPVAPYGFWGHSATAHATLARATR